MINENYYIFNHLLLFLQQITLFINYRITVIELSQLLQKYLLNIVKDNKILQELHCGELKFRILIYSQKQQEFMEAEQTFKQNKQKTFMKMENKSASTSDDAIVKLL
ncbi:unnamed protein product [Paramecium primaurelia]|uniref:Uncharacterized protein n=1 Tax=Paramecium primaurelia TaxID=5886 RepID=A0A8S1KIP8_PARPR|nr:unnamed protein product [Paramecium primaurelia]